MLPNQLHDVGLRLLRGARLPDPVHDTCLAALRRPGRIFSANAVWSRLFLAWVEALTGPPAAAFLPAAVACECMAAGYDLIDATGTDATATSLGGFPVGATDNEFKLCAAAGSARYGYDRDRTFDGRCGT